MLIEQVVVTHGLGRQGVAINWNGKFAAENFEAADMIAVLVRNQDTVELLGRDAALFQAQDQLARAQAAIDQNFTMIGREKGAVARAAAAEHRDTEHCSISNGPGSILQIEIAPA
jgi:hypothetical protein